MASFFDTQFLDAFRLTGLGWVFSLLIAGACLFAASWLVKWQVKKAQKLMAQAEEGDAAGAGPSGTGKGKTPRG